MKRYKVLRITRIVFVGSLLTFLIWTPLSSMALYPLTPLHIQNVEPVSLQATPTVDPTMPALEKEKLVQELNQLKNQNFWSWTNALTPFSTSLSILAALVVAIVGFLRLRADRQEEQRNREDTERHRREDQQIEQKKRDEERFQVVVAGFGDKEEGARVGAAIMLRTFLQSGYEQFYNQALDLAVAHLRLRHADLEKPEPLNSLRQALIIVFKESFPLVRDKLRKEEPEINLLFRDEIGVELDNAYLQLDNAYLANSDLEQVWMPESSLQKANLRRAKLIQANLSGANLNGANLSIANLNNARLIKAKLIGANLFGARLKSIASWEADFSEAEFVEADLSDAFFGRANFSGAKMYGAVYHHTHLEDANLSGADLHYANLSDVSLRGANFRRANLQETILSKAILDSADLNEADLRGARGLTDEQLEECRKRGAIIKDEVSSSDHSSVAEMSKSQVDGVQFQPPTPTQEAHFSPSDAEQIDSKTGFGRRHD